MSGRFLIFTASVDDDCIDFIKSVKYLGNKIICMHAAMQPYSQSIKEKVCSADAEYVYLEMNNKTGN